MVLTDNRTGCGDGQGDYWTTIPTNLTAANSYKIR